MRSKDVILIAVAAYLVLKMTGARAATGAAVPAGGAYAVPTGNQNAEMWLKAGALQVGSQLIRELGRGAAVVQSAVTTGFDGFGLGADVGYSEDSGGYW
ncbi:MAG: hypothetical protein L6Q65_13465 [Zoogloea sp.]|nr:hypothetical protein [Zoogloea sp.]